MVKYQNDFYDTAFKSLSDPTRRDILSRLAKEKLTVSQISDAYDMSMPAVSKHLKVLEDADLVQRKKKGRKFYFSINLKSMKKVNNYFEFYKKFWDEKFDDLEIFLKNGGDKDE